MLYKEESKGLDNLRGYLQDGPRAVTWHVAEFKETAQVPPQRNSLGYDGPPSYNGNLTAFRTPKYC